MGTHTHTHTHTHSLVASDFAAAAVLITMGAVLGKASPFQLIIIAFFELMFYSGNEAINVFVFKAADVGGSMLIHTFGAYFGLAVSFMLYNKKASDHPHNSSIYHSDLFAMIGTAARVAVSMLQTVSIAVMQTCNLFTFRHLVIGWMTIECIFTL